MHSQQSISEHCAANPDALMELAANGSVITIWLACAICSSGSRQNAVAGSYSSRGSQDHRA